MDNKDPDDPFRLYGGYYNYISKFSNLKVLAYSAYPPFNFDLSLFMESCPKLEDLAIVGPCEILTGKLVAASTVNTNYSLKILVMISLTQQIDFNTLSILLKIYMILKPLMLKSKILLDKQIR